MARRPRRRRSYRADPNWTTANGTRRLQRRRQVRPRVAQRVHGPDRGVAHERHGAPRRGGHVRRQLVGRAGRRFNGDGRTDLVWRNSSTGQTAVWLMNGTAGHRAASVFTNAAWAVTHVGDFNGDGKTDLVWRNASTGQTAVWLMNGTAVSQQRSDLQRSRLVRRRGRRPQRRRQERPRCGATAQRDRPRHWLMNGTASTAAAMLPRPPTGASRTSRDFNGDGRVTSCGATRPAANGGVAHEWNDGDQRDRSSFPIPTGASRSPVITTVTERSTSCGRTLQPARVHSG